MQIRFLIPALALSATTACAMSAEPPPSPADVKLGQAVNVDGPVIRPLEVIEDSRCPANARCVWPGQVRLRAEWVREGPDQIIELTSGHPLQLADGMLTLTDVRPVRMSSEKIAPKDYRFGFKFAGGL